MRNQRIDLILYFSTLIFFALVLFEVDALFPLDLVPTSKPIPSGNPDDTKQELEGHRSLFKHSEHLGPTGLQICCPNPTQNKFKSLHSDL